MKIGILLIALALSFVSALPAGTAGTDDGWMELFNGRDMSGWRMIGKGEFRVEEGHLVTQGGMGLFYYQEKKFRDFVLQVEWKVQHHCNNSGIFVRFPEKTEDPWHAVRNGYEIQIDDCDNREMKHRTGAIYDISPAAKIAAKPAGEWNLFEISIVGQNYTVVLNGEKVNEFKGDRSLEGYIGLQNHDPISRVSFRRVRVRELKND